ncbi:hypothetical protein ACF1B0_00465 [Streptomyces anandii]|uniref:hypothetical protein n=1 Tax=Streptomyces anandii TaxID=285454 RepID=UPI0036F77178
MKSTLHSHCVRTLAAGTLSAALLAAGSAGAYAVTAPKPTPSMTHTAMPTSKPSMTAMRSISVKVNRTNLKVGQTATFTGRTAGLKVGSTLVLQHKVNGKWNTLRTTTVVKKGDTFTVVRKFTNKGTQVIRVASSNGAVHSQPVTLKIT